LQKYLDEASDGVIYFSMGSNLKSSQMPESIRNAFVEVFSKLKQRVLWKWEADTLPGQPNNLKLGKWLPQSDILGEPFMPSLFLLLAVMWFDCRLN
jgi:UDP:flavonoid glycosyltransferase YjiC (YdhE family)